ncbi:hypothetical protein [Frigoribacterium sp. CFBP 13712]|uniref:hypothetical protein n=1 Tax=Frigoribacterium sp. CFBP 13712 TaxID=2775309 RepID=UPI001786A237|nr:hypothetical protein [Frigoribacterium sp. CFBP 13712]MBD8704919.1 hypothetical protein [Frigoribacterium sp. CFBP 13712]
MKMKFKAIATVAIVTGLFGAGAAPAFADQGASVVGSQAYYKSSGFQLSAEDTQADSKSALAQVKNSAGTILGSVTNGAGKGQVRYATVANVSKGQTIYIRAGVKDQSASGAASWGAWKQTTA